MLNKKIFVSILIFIISLAPISPLNFIVRSQTIDEYGYEHITDYQEWASDRIITNPIIIDSGATLVIKKGAIITFNEGTFDVLGSLIAEGTIKENVEFRKADGASKYSIGVDGGKLIMRNVDMSGAGMSVQMARSNSIINTANAFYQGGLQINGGILDVEGCNFHDNDVAMFIGDVDSNNIKVNRSKFENNAVLDVAYGGYGNTPNFQYNWWGKADGPSKICYDGQGCYYEKIDGDIDTSNFLKEGTFRDPVIIIPGIIGSMDSKDGKILMPMVYDKLYKTFEENGYMPNKDLFKFPYEWRDSNIENAKLLRDEINKVKEIANWPEVDIVAHSMGGLAEMSKNLPS